MTRYVIRGHWCPTDANPEQDADERVEIEVGCRTLEEVAVMRYWIPDGEVIDRKADGAVGD